MALSKANRIIILLIIDSAFFLLELIVGYAVHSLALVADSFHMLNDVLSLCVGLWAVKVANKENSSKNFTYGWQRAETLGALVNGVFLVALCLSIFLEAIQRLVEPQEVKNPKLVFIVGCFGLLSNILGLLLFHDHSHGGHGHSHGEEGDLHAAENGYHPVANADATTNVVGNGSKGHKSSSALDRSSQKGDAPAADPSSPTRQRNRRYSGRGTIDNLPSHPAFIRQEIINRVNEEDTADSDADGSNNAGEESSDSYADASNNANESAVSETTHLLSHKNRGASYTDGAMGSTLKADRHDSNVHESHHHAQPDPADKKSRSHGDLNMRGVFLHVMGDALGNIGVIASALIIWLTDYSWRFYVDPGISLVITVIILASAIPLCKAASRILLQAMPADMNIENIREDIERLQGILSTHHLHVWQLSDTKLVASLHIKVDCQIKDEGSDRYMRLAKQVRRCLHGYGIHSSTIQPEFATESEIDAQGSPSGQAGSGNDGTSSKGPSRTGSLRDQPGACLLECDDGCPRRDQCCPNTT